MKKACLLAFCFFLILAFVCGCTDGAEESSAPVLSAESSAASVTESSADSAESESSAERSDGESSAVLSEASDESETASSEAVSGEESSKPTESSVKPEESSKPTESSEKPEESSKPTESSEKPEESSKPTESSEEPEESSKPTESSEESEESSKPAENSKPAESSEEPEESSEEESSEEESSEAPDESEDTSAESSEPIESSDETSSETSSEIPPENLLTYEDTLTKDKLGNYSCGVPYGYTWTVNYVNDVIVGEDVTICTTQAAYLACNPNWSITIYAEKQSDGTYIALRDAIAAPGSAAGAGITIGTDQIAIVIHSAASRPGLGYDNWKGKVVAMATKAGDIFEISKDWTSVYAVIPETAVKDPEGDGEVNGIGDAEFIPSGHLLYNGAAYSQAYYSETWGPQYADVYADYAAAFPGVGIHVINHPASVINITNPLVRAMTNDQRAVLDRMEACIYGNVNFVNLGRIFEEHRGEYLYFKSDYHWTQRGAYYAYVEFATSMGWTPTPLESFEERVVNDAFIGHTYDYAQDERVLSFYDTVYAYMPIKEHTYAVYLKDMSLYKVYGNCIQPSIDTYSCFLTGDQAFAVINVPENDQNKTVVVIKESSANAFVPFLTEHYGNIIVIDPRQVRPNMKKIVAEYGADDIIFFATASTSNGSTYCNYYREMLG